MRANPARKHDDDRGLEGFAQAERVHHELGRRGFANLRRERSSARDLREFERR
jgi:hypothetical protein